MEVISCPSALFASVTTRPLSPPGVALTSLSEAPPFLPDPRTSLPCPLESEVVNKPPETQVLPDVSFACSSGLSHPGYFPIHPLWPWSWVVASLLLSVASPSLSVLFPCHQTATSCGYHLLSPGHLWHSLTIKLLACCYWLCFNS